MGCLVHCFEMCDFIVDGKVFCGVECLQPGLRDFLPSMRFDHHGSSCCVLLCVVSREACRVQLPFACKISWQVLCCLAMVAEFKYK